MKPQKKYKNNPNRILNRNKNPPNKNKKLVVSRSDSIKEGGTIFLFAVVLVIYLEMIYFSSFINKMEEEELQLLLIKLADEKLIPFSKKQVEKMDLEKMELVYQQYKIKELDELNENVTDVVIVKIDEVMKRYSLIKEESKLGEKLKNKKLFRQDVKNLISYLTPLLPFVGLFEGGVTIAGEVADNYMEEVKPSGHDIPDAEEEKEEGE